MEAEREERRASGPCAAGQGRVRARVGPSEGARPCSTDLDARARRALARAGRRKRQSRERPSGSRARRVGAAGRARRPSRESTLLDALEGARRDPVEVCARALAAAPPSRAPSLTRSLLRHAVIDPQLTRGDRLVGQVLGSKGSLPSIYTEIEVNYFLLRRLLGVKTDDKKQTKVQKLAKNEVLMVNMSVPVPSLCLGDVALTLASRRSPSPTSSASSSSSSFSLTSSCSTSSSPSPSLFAVARRRRVDASCRSRPTSPSASSPSHLSLPVPRARLTTSSSPSRSQDPAQHARSDRARREGRPLAPHRQALAPHRCVPLAQAPPVPLAHALPRTQVGVRFVAVPSSTSARTTERAAVRLHRRRRPSSTLPQLSLSPSFLVRLAPRRTCL